MITMNGEANTGTELTENTPEVTDNVSCENGSNGISGDNSIHSEDAENALAENGHTDSQQIETNCPSPLENALKSDDELPTKEIEVCNVQDANNGLDSSHSNSNDSIQSEEDALNQTDPEVQEKEDTLNVTEPKIHEKDDTNKDQLNDTESKLETFEIVTIEKHHSDDEVESVNSLDDSDSDVEPRAEDTVSLDSDSDEQNALNSSVIILDGSEKLNGKSDISSEVLVIGSDNENDCVISNEDKLDKAKETKTNVSKKSKKKTNDTNVELRRSSRAIKRKKYSDEIQTLDDESDIEEVFMKEQVTIKSPKVSKINNGKSKPLQNNMGTFVIIDSPVKSKPHTPIVNKTTSSFSQAMYQTIVSRGTSVTPVSAKSVVKPIIPETQVTPTPPPPILPTLTDDMFVVEAPSFIVPYVYEKPAKLPFKEYLEKLGKQIKEENDKIEQALLEKKKAEKEKRQQERQERRERGEQVAESEEEGPAPSAETDQVKKIKAENKEKRRRKKEDDDVSWDGSSSSESDDTITDDETGNVVIKDKADDLVVTKTTAEVTPDATAKTNSYFDLNLGKFFMNIGENLVQEFVQTDLLKQQNRKLQREKKAGRSTASRTISIALLTKNLERSQKTNEIYSFEQQKCKFCTFKTESQLAMAHHLETPHMKNNLYTCNFCEFEIKTPHDILYHMECKHGVKGKLERALSTHQCANCPFEDHGKGKLARHLVACAKRFKPETNLAPPIDWEHPAKIAKLARNRNNMTTPYQISQFGRNHVDGSMKMGIPISEMPENKYKNRGFGGTRLNLPMAVRPAGIPIRPAPPPAHSSNFNAAKKMPSALSITPVPRQNTPPAIQMSNQPNAKGFVICEICDGYIKDLELLRNHMQWIHKVKIHPKMIYNRPPLNCQKCQFRFFTDQGLERHLLGSHGLVTSSMQEAANKGKDAGRCPVCGKVYQWKLLSHVSRDHNLTLKPAHLSYKCTVCTATFGMYRQFENHVYSVHSVVAKKVMDKNTKTKTNVNDGKQLKINDEITVTPQPVKLPANKK